MQYFIESWGCREKYLAFRNDERQCNNATVMLRSESQSKGLRRVWRLNAAFTVGQTPGASPVVAYGRLPKCRTTKYINLAGISPGVSLGGRSWKNRIIPVDVNTLGCTIVTIQAFGDTPYNGKYLGYGDCNSQSAFKWEADSSSTATHWKLRKADPSDLP